MRRITREECPPETLHRLLNGVTFFKELIHNDPSQFELLMSVSRFGIADQGEIILHKDEAANILYFLLRGELDVLADDNLVSLNIINAGEMLGVMAMVLDQKRSASLRVRSRNAILAGISYEHFQDINDFNVFSLETKLSFFRMLNSNVRWNVEKNRIANPNHPLVPRLRTIPIFTGPRNTEAELEALHKQAHVLCELLSDWNASLVNA
ncbi:cyclic nucleotide-binding domain-containing protein [Parathalassolituus penaei]|uniref:Cyclic nucleotide-binding domain-containing protein n=1 Tax=Parathalassolituus penaei TaxID=2997323 RepID=A0A9X3ITN2_9GAMM|nr:cyclic nucleotide-binding domain-containing protein [Parathalassolituus penaei]MCY0966069.1 cyclic nucleotide-binding domain-containing protein [Parathalassolituus penaei]